MSNPDWYIDPPDEKFGRCECGHSEEDHNEPDDLEQSELRLALEEIDNILDTCKPEDTKWKVSKRLSQALAVCATCECRLYREGDNDDFDEDTGTDRE